MLYINYTLDVATKIHTMKQEKLYDKYPYLSLCKKVAEDFENDYYRNNVTATGDRIWDIVLYDDLPTLFRYNHSANTIEVHRDAKDLTYSGRLFALAWCCIQKETKAKSMEGYQEIDKAVFDILFPNRKELGFVQQHFFKDLTNKLIKPSPENSDRVNSIFKYMKKVNRREKVKKYFDRILTVLAYIYVYGVVIIFTLIMFVLFIFGGNLSLKINW